MPIEVAMGALFLLRQAGALVGGILEKTRGNIEQAGADQLTKFVFKVAKGPNEREQADSTTQAEMEAEITAEQATITEVLEENEAGAEELQSRFGFALTSALPADRTGTDASLVRAYEAVLWRLSVLASWERRAIAVSGALQGRDWITICAPRVPGAVIAPSSIWKAADADSVLRRPLRGAPVKFFVRPNAGNAKPDDELTAVDTKLRRDGARRFEPAQPAEPTDVDVWHRVDGLHAVWVPLQPDTHGRRARKRECTYVRKTSQVRQAKRRDSPAEARGVSRRVAASTTGRLTHRPRVADRRNRQVREPQRRCEERRGCLGPAGRAVSWKSSRRREQRTLLCLLARASPISLSVSPSLSLPLSGSSTTPRGASQDRHRPPAVRLRASLGLHPARQPSP